MSALPEERAARELAPLVSAHRAALLRYARSLGAGDDAEDVVQEVILAHFLELREHGKTYTRDAARARLFWRVRQRCHDERRRDSRRGSIVRRIAGGVSATIATHVSSPFISGIRRWMRPDHGVERDEILRAFREALRCLPPRAREILSLIHECELSCAEVATVLGLQPRSVRVARRAAEQRVMRTLTHLGVTPATHERLHGGNR